MENLSVGCKAPTGTALAIPANDQQTRDLVTAAGSTDGNFLHNFPEEVSGYFRRSYFRAQRLLCS